MCEMSFSTAQNLALMWFTCAIVLSVIEILSPLFGFVLVAFAALVATFCAAMGFSFLVQLLAFSVSLVLLLGLLRPKIVAKIYSSVGIPSRTEVLIGKEGIVIEPIDPIEQAGRVIVAGEDWAAHADKLLPRGTPIKVIGSDGIVLKVIELKSN